MTVKRFELGKSHELIIQYGIKKAVKITKAKDNPSIPNIIGELIILNESIQNTPWYSRVFGL
jgi:hypothetical protein